MLYDCSMQMSDFTTMARDLMLEHGCGRMYLNFNNTGRRIASMNFDTFPTIDPKRKYRVPRGITFSKRWVEAMDEEDCRNLMLHEIAHALVVHKDQGHGAVFKAMCRKLGTPASNSCYPAKTRPEATWKGHCPVTGKLVSRMHGRPRKARLCACHRKRLNWTENNIPKALTFKPQRSKVAVTSKGDSK